MHFVGDYLVLPAGSHSLAQSSLVSLFLVLIVLFPDLRPCLLVRTVVLDHIVHTVHIDLIGSLAYYSII